MMRYADLFRPNYEAFAAATWFGSACIVSVLAVTAPCRANPFGWVALGAFMMALVRAIPAWRHWRRRSRLAGAPLSFMSIDELAAKVKERPDAFWLGYGFDWSREHRQIVHEIGNLDPAKITPNRDDEMGHAWIHGLGETESDIWVPDDHLAGHIGLAGTTGSGKTRCLDLLIAQSILKGRAVIVIDPKPDNDLRDAIRATCAAVGRERDFIYFHPGFPDRSCRLNLLQGFNRSTEIATRVATLIPSETGSDPFTAFGQMAMTHIVNGLLMVGETPNLVKLRRYIEGGVESLIIRVMRAYFDKCDALKGWQQEIVSYLRAREGGRPVPEAAKYIQFYRDKVQPRPGLANSEVEGLIGMYEHDREHFGKMVTALLPVLTMLTAGELGELLSPDESDDDPRPTVHLERVIKNGQVLYCALDSLSDVYVGSAIGALLIADLCSTAGRIYNYDTDKTGCHLFVDEASSLSTKNFVDILNKARGAGIRCLAATQTLADYAAKLGSENHARSMIGNLNSTIAMRLIDGPTQQYVCESFPTTEIHSIERMQSNQMSSEHPLAFSGTLTEKLSAREVELVPPALMGCLANLQFFAKVSGGRVVKGRQPILRKPELTGAVETSRVARPVAERAA